MLPFTKKHVPRRFQRAPSHECHVPLFYLNWSLVTACAHCCPGVRGPQVGPPHSLPLQRCCGTQRDLQG